MRRAITSIAGAIMPIIAATTIALGASADTADPPAEEDLQAKAERLFDEGKALLAKDDWTAACALFDASAKLVEAIPALVKVARCAAHDGHRVKAIEVYERALAQKPWPELERLVRAELFELEKETPSIRVTLVAPASGVILRRNGQVLSAEAYRERLWTDVGAAEHLEAAAPGYHAATFDVSAKTGGEVIDVRVALAEDKPPVPPPAPPPPPPPRTDVRRPVAWALTGSGALGLALGAGFGVEYLVRRGSLFDDCTETLKDGTHVCPGSTSERYDATVAARTRTAVLLSVGAALATTGVVLLVTAPKTPERAARGHGGVWIGAGPSAVEIGGSF